MAAQAAACSARFLLVPVPSPTVFPLRVTATRNCFSRSSASCPSPSRRERAKASKARENSPVGGFPEIAAFCVFYMGLAHQERDLHIRNGCADQNTLVGLFFQMGQDQSLPVQIQVIGATSGVKDQSAAPFARLQQQVHLGIMAQRLKMAYTFNGVFYGFFIENSTGIKFIIL